MFMTNSQLVSTGGAKLDCDTYTSSPRQFGSFNLSFAASVKSRRSKIDLNWLHKDFIFYHIISHREIKSKC